MRIHRFFSITSTFATLFLCASLLSCSPPSEPESHDILNLWYPQPATDWMTEALPIGNAYMGAMVFGGIEEERIQFNEESLWAGGPGEWKDYRGGNRQAAHRALPEIRGLILEGKYEQAHDMANEKLTGIIAGTDTNEQGVLWQGFGAYQAFGDVHIAIPGQGDVQDYSRSLDLDRAVAKVTYRAGTVNHRRQYFASYPARMLVFNLENDAAKGQDYRIRLSSPHKVHFRHDDNRLIMSGALENNGMAFEARLEIRHQGGNLEIKDNQVVLKGAQNLILLLTAATDYLNEYPHYKGRDYVRLNRTSLEAVKGQSFDELLQQHLEDYQALFQRVSLQLPQTEFSTQPTDQRVNAYGEGADDPALEALFFQYGRYLLISSSRPGSLPANLQGKWNHLTRPPWASDYHFNINIQMIYWPAEITNLAEVHLPLLQYVKSLREPGRVTANEYFGARGWVVNTMNNPFGFTAPGWSLPWGYFPSASAWLSRHFWENYLYNADREFLQQQALPVMEETLLFWLDYLSEDDNGKLASIPSYSPEHGGISAGASMDQQIVWDLFTNYLQAVNVLGLDTPLAEQVRVARDRLVGPQIGRWGQLQEWSEDRDEPDNKHRHVSHLYAVYPGQQINWESTPDLAKAAEVSLNARGDQGTGWSLGWKVNLWARLGDGNRAYRLLRKALRPAIEGDVEQHNGNYYSGIYSNLFSTHPPIQLDGNMGATAGIAEMLVQSHEGVIRLLPALPDAWPQGRVAGLKARGGYQVDIQWDQGELVEARIVSFTDGAFEIEYQGRTLSLDAVSGIPLVLNTASFLDDRL